MRLELVKDHRNLKAGTRVALTPNKPNFWVGANGSGKSSLLGLMLSHLPIEEYHWAAADNAKDAIKVTGFEHIKKVIISSPRLRSIQQVDLTSTIQMGLNRLYSSDGQNNIQDVMNAFKEKDNPDALFIFDETDGHLDFKTKYVFFAHLLPQLKGTSIVISHDPYYLDDLFVLDFTDFQRKIGNSYYLEQMDSLPRPKAATPPEP